MLFEKNFRLISAVPDHILSPIIYNCTHANWFNESYQRVGTTYGIQPVVKQKTLRFPSFPISERNKVYTDEHKEILASAEPLLEWILSLSEFQGYKFVQGQISTLLPNIELEWHVDMRWYHAFGNRLHVPIITNDKCFHTWEDEEYHMEVGYLYDLNNRILHSAKNFGNEFRTHIILDVLPETTWNSALEQKINPLSLIPYTDNIENDLNNINITTTQIINLIAHGTWSKHDLNSFAEAIRYGREKTVKIELPYN